MTFTIMIPSRNRCQDLEETCRKLGELQPGPDEIIVFADGCIDGTAGMIRERFPKIRLLESTPSKGSVYARDQMLRVACGEIVLSLDDDSYPLQMDFLERLGEVFEKHPEAAVVVFPENRNGSAYATKEKSHPGQRVAAYANCAAAMRRAFYVKQPGFPQFFEHMYEEPDYALQCYAAGASVWLEPSLGIRHRESGANRNPIRRHHLNARNELWSVWLRCPWPLIPLVSSYRVARQCLYALSEGPGWAVREPIWWLAAMQGLPRCWKSRQVVPWQIYLDWLTMTRRGRRLL